jgi:hypothetical protein
VEDLEVHPVKKMKAEAVKKVEKKTEVWLRD